MSGAAAEDFRPFADPDLSGLSNVEGLRETFSHTLLRNFQRETRLITLALSLTLNADRRRRGRCLRLPGPCHLDPELTGPASRLWPGRRHQHNNWS